MTSESSDEFGEGNGDDDSRAGTRRRDVLAIAAAVLGGGCIARASSTLDIGESEQVSLSIKTLVADEDATSTRIAHDLAEKLNAVGIDATVTTKNRTELFRDVLLNHEFDLYVCPYYGERDPDALRSLLHSEFVSAPGWHNPFGFATRAVDDLLDRQRREDGQDRQGVLDELQGAIAEEQPFTVIGFPRAVRAVRTDRFTDWRGAFEGPLGYFTMSPVDAEIATLRLSTTNEAITRNLNPLAVAFRSDDPVVDLVYDPLAREFDGEMRPWLAADWEWAGDEPGPVATVRLREDLQWHDGRELTVGDVAFTYRFLKDTSLDSADHRVPAPGYRGRVSLLDEVTRVDSRTVELRFVDCSRAVAARALSVPVLPRHVWATYTDAGEVTGLAGEDYATEALAWSNPEPVGSGPLEVVERVDGERLELVQNPDHPVARGDLPVEVPFDRLELRVAPASAASIELVRTEEADATATAIDPGHVSNVHDAEGVEVLTSDSAAFYHVGYNVRSAPLGNYRFRRALASLVDQEYLVEWAFLGSARPAVSPLAGTDYLAPDLAWEGRDPVLPFPGEDGEIDESAARELFADAGYRYDRYGRLLG